MQTQFFLPTRWFFGENAFTAHADTLAPLGGRCLILTGKHSAARSGALTDATDALTRLGIAFDVFDGIGANPLLSACHAAGAAARACGAHFILGIGGGSVLDAAKAVAIYAANPTLAPFDIYLRVYDAPPLPVALIGTTAGTGSEVTGVSVLTNDETGRKKSISGPDCYAAVSFCDPRYTASMPRGITVSTALDAFAHAVEGYFTKTCDGVHLLFAQRAIPLLYQGLCALAACGDVPEALREPLYDGAIHAGLVINACGTGFPHPLGYVLTEHYGIPHGMACAAFFPAFLARCRQFAPEKAAAFFEMTDEPDAVVATIRSLTALPGVRFSPAEAAAYAARWKDAIPKNFTASPGGLTQEEAAEILADVGRG
ncbi:MAG: iron-containing alcohol dehydrogenase [Clostridia bacterium]|nr:iron-containing alcohol dehydrogenase [Clostridia bacterium]